MEKYTQNSQGTKGLLDPIGSQYIRAISATLYMAQISEGGGDSKGMTYFFKLWDLNVTRNALICTLRLLPQFNDTNASMDVEQK